MAMLLVLRKTIQYNILIRQKYLTILTFKNSKQKSLLPNSQKWATKTFFHNSNKTYCFYTGSNDSQFSKSNNKQQQKMYS